MLRKYSVALVAALAVSLSAAVPPAKAAICTPVNAVAAPPVVSGTAQVGQTLVTTNGAWTGGPTSFAYQWLSAGTAIVGATAQTYVQVAGDVGNAIQSSVAATNPGGTSCYSISASTLPIIAAPTVANVTLPVITGTPQVGQTLMSSTGTWTNNPGITTYAYQWFTSAAGGTTSQTTAKVHFEFTANTMVTPHNTTDGVGFSASSHTFASMGYIGNDTASLGYFASGQVLFNNVSPLAANAGTQYSQGNTLAVEIDFNNKLILVKNITQAGNWNNSGTSNPGTGVTKFCRCHWKCMVF